MSMLVTGGRDAAARGRCGLLAARGIPYRPGARERDTPDAVHCDLADPATFPGALGGSALAVLADPALADRAYTLTGPQSLNSAARLSTPGDVLGRSIPGEAVSAEQ